jgi:hypothetical protein
MGHSFFLFYNSSVKVKNLPLFTTISHKKVFHSFFWEVISCQLAVVREATFGVVGGYQLSG